VDLATLREAARRGIAKVNIGTAVRRAFVQAWLECAPADPPRERFLRAREKVRGELVPRLEALGAAGRYAPEGGDRR
jgi:fructose/tagatose bisphosphate aldolase